jgi:FkbM family methyltransferase
MALSDEQVRARPLRVALQKVVHRLGFHIGRNPPVDSLAYHIKVLLRELSIDCVIDVGAHVGEYGRFLRDLGYRGEIASFEPISTSFEALGRERGRDPSWRIERVAVGAQEGEREMNVYQGSVFNSLLRANAYGAERFGDALKLQRTEKVRVRTLASIIDECRAADPSRSIFVKIDTQGYDLEVLASAGMNVQAIRALQTEQATRPMYEAVPSFPQALDQLHHLGFEITGIFPVARDHDHLRVIEFDLVLCRTPR